MDKEELINLAENRGVFHCAERYGCQSDAFKTALLYFAYDILERAAQHFDERGKYEDGSWSEGFYDPQDPGEILRGLAEGKKKDTMMLGKRKATKFVQ